MAEYARTYGGPPAPDASWSLVLALASRTARFEARERLAVLDGVLGGTAGMFDADAGRQVAAKRDELVREAFPVGGPLAAKGVPNLWAGEGPDA